MINAEFKIDLIEINNDKSLINLFKFDKFILLKRSSKYSNFIKYLIFRFFLLIVISWYFPSINCEIYWSFCISRIKTCACETSSISSNLNFGFGFALALLILFLLILDFLIDILLNFSLPYFFKIFKSGESVFRDIKIIFSIANSNLGRLNI